MSHRIILSAGGTGGHIFPAIAVAHAVRQLQPRADILFVGAKTRMEMEKVPQAGFHIEGLDVAGIQRGFDLRALAKNILWPFTLIRSLWQAYKIITNFKPDAVAGFGGYASGPVLFLAQLRGIPTLIQEQNSYAGITNKILAIGAKKICAAYEDMEQYFPKNKLIISGNPVRPEFNQADLLRIPACMHFKFTPHKKTLLVIGGSQGARSINKAIDKHLDVIEKAGIQLIWQTGKNFIPSGSGWKNPNFSVQQFIHEMHWAYAAAHVVVSRAGALSISELCLVGRPSILVPLPTAAEDHQTKNAYYLYEKGAALIIPDQQADEKLVQTALELLANDEKMNDMGQKAKNMAKPNAATEIATELLTLTTKT